MEPFLGQTILFAGNFAPRGWALCEGQILPINTNQALFSILGTTYGGDGRTSFALPDLRGRAPVSQGDGDGLPSVALGQRGGNANTTLTAANLPVTQVNIFAYNGDADLEAAGGNDPAGKVVATPANDEPIYTNTTPNAAMRDGALIGAANTQYSNQAPYLAINYIIALQGVFPSRN